MRFHLESEFRRKARSRGENTSIIPGNGGGGGGNGPIDRRSRVDGGSPMKRVLVLLVAGSILSGIAAYAAMAMPAPPEKPSEKPNK
jgi:hypothetical protein